MSLLNHKTKMFGTKSDTPLVITLRIIFDGVLLIIAAIPSIIFYSDSIQPYQRGFFCDDHSIMYPYHQSTISTLSLILVGGLVNIFLILVCEAVHYTKLPREILEELPRYRTLCLRTVPPYLYNVVGLIWALGFGAMINQGITDIGKWSIGRLRPHFIDGCNPNINLTNCDPRKLYINFSCLQENQEILKDLRLSFPSGHASLSAYWSVFAVCYIQSRVPRLPCSYLLKTVLQFVCVLGAWFTGLSRVMDNKHHWSDVLTGWIIGIAVGIFVVRYVLKTFLDPYRTPAFRRFEPSRKAKRMLDDSCHIESGRENGPEDHPPSTNL